MTVNGVEGVEEVAPPDQETQLVMQEMDIQDSGLQTIVGAGGEQQQVVMMTNGDGHQQQVVITSDGGHLMATDNVIHVQGDNNQTFVLHTSKTEPEDLSFSVGDRPAHEGGLRQIDLEAGAQAIQASAATAVQNVLRSLKESDKSILNQILPHHILSDVGPNSSRTITTANGDMIIDETRSESGNLDDIPETLTTFSPGSGSGRRSRSQDTGRVQIPKQFSPYGFHSTLEAATAQWVRKDEDRCTYMNKGQFYGVSLEYRANPAEALHGNLNEVKTVVMLVFRDAKNPEDEVNAWAFWHQRQPSSKQRILDAETNNISDDCGIARIEDLAYNAICVYWHPLQKPALISVAIQCLSTDFSLQKGVKGLPMHLQIDTYVKNPGDGEYDIVHRGYCQVKVFCDKGAERKFRQEERRAARKVATGGQRVLDMYHQCQERSDFYSMVDLSKVPVLYTPSAGEDNSPTVVSPAFPLTAPAIQTTLSKSNAGVSEVKRRKTFPPPETRMVVYVRQENEEIYTPLHLVPPTVPGLARAIESKYNVSATAIRYLYRRNTKGIIAKLDDDLLKFYCNEDTFLMQVTAIELEGLEGPDSIMYDITLCEIGE